MSLFATIKEVVPFISADWPVKVILRKKRGDSWVTVEDRARRIHKATDEGEKYELKNQGKETAPIPYEALEITENGENLLELYEAENGEFISLKFDPDKDKIRELAAKKSSQAYRYNRYNEARTLYQPKGWLEKWHTEISLLLFGVFLILVGVAVNESFKGVAATMKTSANTFAQAAQNIAGG